LIYFQTISIIFW